MPWAERTLMLLRQEFVRLVEAGGIPMSQLCQRFGISRKTGYKWVRRYQATGPAGLTDRSRRPQHVVRQVPEAIRAGGASGAARASRVGREEVAPTAPAAGAHAVARL